jgi:hypothetical protein
MAWKKGESGNIQGRPPGTGEVAQLRAALGEHLPEVIAALVEAAKKGDTAAARLILERTVPALRPEEMPVNLDGVGGSRAEMIAAVVEAIANGELDVSRGGRLIAALTPEALEEKIAKFERMIEEQKNEQ